MSSSSSISVTVRVRPFSIREAAQITKIDEGPQFFGDGSLAGTPAPKITGKGLRSVVKVIDDQLLVFDPPEDNPMARFQKTLLPQGKKVKDIRFGFDRVFDENVTQEDVYEGTTRGLLDNVLDGYNATVFAYGATGCGKTHTISGNPQQPGIIFLTCKELFQRIDALKDEKEVQLTLSYLEIYNETIRDLLIEGGSSKVLALREDSNQAIAVAGLSTHCPKNVHEVMDIIMMGNNNRTMSPTEANATSSRSHAVLQINVQQKDRASGLSQNHTLATLSIIDLAGSERASVTKNRGERLLEGANINRSLLALGNCINALCDPVRRNHVPYRDSKLTRLLKFSLGGNCKTVMIVCVSPSSQHYDETHNTLKYANRAKNIKTKATRNTMNVNRHVSQYVKAIYDLTQEVEELKKRLGNTTKEAIDKMSKQQSQRDVVVKESSRRIKAAYDNSADMRAAKIQDYKNMRLMERRIALVMSWTAAFDGVFAGRGDQAPPKALFAIRGEAEKVLQELQQNRFALQNRLNGPTSEREIERALETSLKNLRAVEGVTEADVATVTCEASLYKTMVEREFYHSLAAVDVDVTAAVISLTRAHFDAVAGLSQMSVFEEGLTDTARKSLQDLMKLCTDATSQVVKPNGELISPADSFKVIPRIMMAPPSSSSASFAAATAADTPRKQKKLAPMDMASPIRGPFAQALTAAGMTNPAVTASPMLRPSPRAFKVGTPKKAVMFAKKSPKKKRVRWYDEYEAEDLNVAAIEENKRTRTEAASQLSADSHSHHQQQLFGIPPPAPVTTRNLDHPSSSSSSSARDSSTATTTATSTSSSSSSTNFSSSTTTTATTASAAAGLDQPPVRPRNNRMEMGFLSKKADAGPPVTASSSSSSSSHPAATSQHSHHHPRPARKSDFPLRDFDTSALNLHRHDDRSDIGSGDDTTITLNKPWRPSTSAASKSSSSAAAAAASKRRVSIGSLTGPQRTARRRPHHATTIQEGNTSVVFKPGHARRMPKAAPEKENNHNMSTVLSPKPTVTAFKSTARRSTISGRADISLRISSAGVLEGVSQAQAAQSAAAVAVSAFSSSSGKPPVKDGAHGGKGGVAPWR
ncbi:P-loop containing nucleoside triphosphate hydrolase protein [Peziza echinospora]|nr:P-loop containing nucleoside triphosphate hydrolase protein [Peziza echinospora]